ncbi:hypothetical protein OROGR_012925 [Orobanche gracilis]
MKEMSSEESLIYAQMRPNEISHSLSICDNRMKRRRCREDSSVSWYNLDKTKPVKGYRCTEFDHRRRKTDSSKYIHLLKDLKHSQQEKATISDSKLELQEQDNKLQSSESDSSASGFEDSDGEQVSNRLSACVKRENSNRDDDASEASLLFDVPVLVKASCRAENVPFVCLTSQSNGQAILGHPVEIHELKSEFCENLCPEKESGGHKPLDDGRSRFPRLVWRTARRTPVCYVTSSKDNEIVQDSKMPAEEIKNSEKLNQGKEATSRSCGSVGLIFSKILSAVGQK